MNRLLHLIVFLAGLAAIVWIGAGYVGTNPLALAVTTLIGVCYLAGAIELARYHQTTLGLTQALQSLSAPVATLDDWIARVPAGLRTAVRLRVEGGRASLPAPALAPYLVGLLVLLGMLGTFLGMVATLRGTALALDGSTDLQAMRASLAAPVKGLGFAFGTSVAGVAASAMLGLLSALCRRARLQASQSLDTAAATSLHAFSQAHQRAENLQLMRAQADSLPVLAERLQTMMDNMERQSRALNERLQAGQDAFHGKTEAVYGRLADSVQNALTHSVAESAQAAGTAIQPAVAHAMQTLAQESTAWRESISQAMQQQLDHLSARLEQTSATLAEQWRSALAEQQQANQALNQALGGTLREAADTLQGSASQTAQSWSQALAQQQQSNQTLQQTLQGTLEQFASGFDARTSTLVGTVSSQLNDSTTQIAAATAAMTGHWRQALDSQQTAQQAQAEALEGALARFGNQFEERSQALVQRVAQRLDDSAATVSGQVQEALHSWQQALQEQQQNQGTLTDRMAQALAQVAADFEQRSASLLTDMSARLDGTARAVAEGTAGALQDWHAALQAQQQTQQAQAETQRDALQAHTQAFAARSAEMAAEIAARMDQSAGQLAELWQQALARHEAAGQALLQAQQLAQQANADRFAEQSQALLATVDQAHGRLHGELAARDEARLSAWTTSLAGVAAALRTEWEDTGTRTLARQQEICDRFAAAVHDITTQAEHQSRQTIGEIERLLEAASQAPKAATEMLAELRQQLSDSLARDNAMLQERGHLLQTVDTLLAAINHASGEQRQAIDALVAASAELMGRASEQFAAQVEDKARQLNETAGQIEGAAVEVASLGEAFGAAVAHFGQANEKLLIQLERIEGALGQSLARSDEQLAYYVAQAREVVDLSMLSQKQILQELQQIKREGGDAA